MMRLVADKEICKACACVVKMPCIVQQQSDGHIIISPSRLEEEEVLAAVSSVIKACPLKAVNLVDTRGVKILL